jgi:hypothetical protein
VFPSRLLLVRGRAVFFRRESAVLVRVKAEREIIKPKIVTAAVCPASEMKQVAKPEKDPLCWIGDKRIHFEPFLVTLLSGVSEEEAIKAAMYETETRVGCRAAAMAEAAGKNRTTVIEAFRKRARQLPEGPVDMFDGELIRSQQKE